MLIYIQIDLNHPSSISSSLGLLHIKSKMDGVYWCDGWPNCKDKSDEGIHCREWQCHDDFWKCADELQCIRSYLVCDGQSGVADWFGHISACNDLSDENNRLCGYCTNENLWSCHDNKECIDINMVCDGRSDCHDHSDEDKEKCLAWGCPTNTDKCADKMPRQS